MSWEHQRGLVWFRRDLRLTDHPSLLAACRECEEVIPVYCLSDWRQEHRWTGEKRQSFLAASLASLAANLESRNSSLTVRQGNAVTELISLAKETGATAIHTARDPDPFGRATEKALQLACQRKGITFHTHKDHALHEREEILTGSETPYRVFTPYFNNWIKQPKPASQSSPSHLSTPSGIATLELPSLNTWGLPHPTGDLLEGGERAARRRMRFALETGGIADQYLRDRDTPSGQTTSRLGQDLRFGLISPRELIARVQQAAAETDSAADRAGIETFLKELAWREFYMQILYHYPEVLRHEFNPDYRGMTWERDPDSERFRRWCTGETGFPIVDAGIRQLLSTGFMHNRVRMIVSMFLTKDLHIDWRLGERFFMQHLVDGEIASNNGGWQWSAGTGADAAPYFRIQNPWTQTKRFDPQGLYIKEWIPELAEVDPRQFQTPAEPLAPLAAGYPAPMVDHAVERLITLDLFKAYRQGASGLPVG